jgi:hypothetical protein
MPVPWPEKFKRMWMETRLAHEAMTLEKLQRQSGLVDRLVRKTQDGTLGKPTGEPQEFAEAATMGVMIGNEIHHHYEPGAPSKTATGPAADTPLWKKAAALAAIMAATGGGGAALSTYLMQPDEEPPAIGQPVEFPVPPGYGVEVEKFR